MSIELASSMLTSLVVVVVAVEDQPLWRTASHRVRAVSVALPLLSLSWFIVFGPGAPTLGRWDYPGSLFGIVVAASIVGYQLFPVDLGVRACAFFALGHWLALVALLAAYLR